MVTGTIPFIICSISTTSRSSWTLYVSFPNLSIKFASTGLVNNHFTDLFKYLKFRKNSGISLINSNTDIVTLKEGKLV